jgi:hypothetical protein
MAYTADQPNGKVNHAKDTAPRASTLLTERSIPAVMITTVIPHAKIPYTDTCLSMSRCTLHLRKAPSALKMQPIMTISRSAKSARATGDDIHAAKLD